MKRLLAVIVVAAIVGSVVWFVWLAPNGEEPTAEPATDVAVRVGKITRTTLHAYVTAYGVVRPEPAGDGPAASASVAPSVPGVVVSASKVEGQHVTKGELLFQLDSRAADVAVEFAEKSVAREQRLIRIEGTSESALQNAQQQLDAARVQQALLRVQSPLSGTVTRVNVKPGEAVDLATVMADVVDLDRLVVSANVPSAELAALKLGQSAEVVFADSAAPLAGTVSFISPEVDVQNGTAEVRVRLPSGSVLRPGQFVTLRVVSAEHADELAVPVGSVVRNEEGASVIAIVDGDMARQTTVTTGLEEGGLIEVEGNGLQAGMVVVTDGAYALPAETRVRVLAD